MYQFSNDFPFPDMYQLSKDYKCSNDFLHPPDMYQFSKDFFSPSIFTNVRKIFLSPCTNYRKISCHIVPRHVPIFDRFPAVSLPDMYKYSTVCLPHRSPEIYPKFVRCIATSHAQMFKRFLASSLPRHVQDFERVLAISSPRHVPIFERSSILSLHRFVQIRFPAHSHMYIFRIMFCQSVFLRRINRSVQILKQFAAKSHIYVFEIFSTKSFR